MYKALSPWAICVRPANVDEAIQAAVIGGFQGVEVSAHEVADLIDTHGADSVKAKFTSAGVQAAAFGLPVEYRGDEQKWRDGLAVLPRLANAAAAIGAVRTSTWIMPCSNDLNFDLNRRFHIERFTPIAEILATNGCSLGLEFIGPKTLRDSQRFPFIYTMEAMLDMGAAIGPNVGLLLDCWHWHTSCGTIEQLYALKPEQVVYVHVNDAPAGVVMDAHFDNIRGLPGETGVIDIRGFLRALDAIGYDGPVTPEPFVDLSALPSDTDRLKLVGAAMDKIFGMR
jgi:sugar phosphate isomerase/epimerase